MPPDAPMTTPAAPSNSPFVQPINPTAVALANEPPKPVTRVAAPPTPPNAADWARMTPDARAEHTRSLTDAGRTSASVHTRTADGRVLVNGKLPDGTVPDADPNAPPADPAAPVAGEKFKVGQFEISEGELASMMERQAQDDLRKATLPPTPNDYKLEISPQATLPGNMQVKFDPNDPSMVAVKNWAHAKGLDQGSLSEMLTLYASHVATQEAALLERSQQEIAKVGPNAPQRVDAVTRWIRAEVGDADAAPIIATLVTDSHLRFYEKLITAKTSQGTAGFRQTGRDVDTGKVDEATYNSWSYSQKKDYAARHGGGR